MIPIVLTVYKRPQYLERQLEMIQSQTCIRDIRLHVISNNPNIEYKKILDRYSNNFDITFVQRNNKLQSFERHIYCHSQEFEFVILIDDDIFIDENAIEKIWNQRENNTLKSHWLRQFKQKDFEEDKNVYTDILVTNDTNLLYNYAGANLCMYDTSIYDISIKNFKKYRDEIYKNYSIKIERLDDIFISWVANTNGYSIKSFGISPTEFLGNDDVSLVKYDWNSKDSFTKILHKIKPWSFYI